MRSLFDLGWRVFLPVLLLAAIFAARPSLAQRIVCVTEEMPPLQQKADGRIGGFSTEVVTAALERAGLEYTLDIFPWARAYAMAHDAPNTLIFSIIRTPEREQAFKWGGEITPILTQIYRLASRSDVNPANIEEAKRYKTVVIRDDARHRLLASHGFIEGVNMVVVSNIIEQFRALTTFPDVCLIPLSDITMQGRARAAGLDPDALMSLFATGEPQSLQAAFSLKTQDEVVERFSAALESLKREGFVGQAKARWGIR